MRSVVLIAYAFGLAVAFSRNSVDLEEPQLPGRDSDDASWDYNESQV